MRPLMRVLKARIGDIQSVVPVIMAVAMLDKLHIKAVWMPRACICAADTGNSAVDGAAATALTIMRKLDAQPSAARRASK